MTGPDGETFDEWLELSNGCVCCAVRDDLVSAIERLMELRGRFDYVIVETTGMADPGPGECQVWILRTAAFLATPLSRLCEFLSRLPRKPHCLPPYSCGELMVG